MGASESFKGKQWHALGTKVTGATHVRNDLPCQDAIRIETYGKYVVAAIADGHGSEACSYSDDGSQAAVDCLHELCSDIISCAGAETKDVIENSRELRLPRQLAAAWRQRVSEIHSTKRDGEEFSYTLYGTTALCVVASPDFVFALQLGDGDILAVPDVVMPEDKEKDKEPAPASPPLGYWLIESEYMPGNETYSLCIPDCWRYVKTHMIYPGARRAGEDAAEANPPPALIMLTTDGYFNSFLTNEGFVKAGADILKMLKTKGAEYVAENLEGWLESSTSEGSGDDIAMALVYLK